ncbi:hypothetical protein SCG7086_BQ_00010 [Chlamydiales bacterium SCGC AG-110-P3]|nr:hypothetical protein SCG7086_BQ_00010 [Chlamydiales bacterium SCGC AG-110-P3]
MTSLCHPRPGPFHMLVSALTHIPPAKIAQYPKGKSSFRLQREFPNLQKWYWGRHLWARGYFCCTVGAVNEEMIRRYIENQADDEGTFKVWDNDTQTPV